MRFAFFASLLLFPLSALAAEPAPDPRLSQDKIQFGQLLIQLGQAELKIQEMQKELDATKHAEKSPNESKDAHHVP